MKKIAWNIFIVLALMAGAGEAGYLVGHHAGAAPAGDAADSDDVSPVPTVQTTPIRLGRVDQKIVAYGVVTAQTSDVSVLSVAFESRVRKILASPGQRLNENAPVIEVEASPDVQLEMLQDLSAVQAAEKDLEQTRSRFTNHLATNQDLSQVQQVLDLAKLKLDAMKKEGADKPVQLQAAGLLAKIDVQEGQIVPAGAALAEVAGGGKLQARLGLEPEDAGKIHAGDSVSLFDVRGAGTAVRGQVRMVAQRIDPDSRLVDVFVSLPADSAMALDAFVRGELTLSAQDGLVVPASAVLPGDDGYSLFVVDGGKAVAHKVTIGSSDDQSAQITGDGLAAGQQVVIVGNFELQDGMSVKTAAVPTPPMVQEAGQ